jgi:parallel beta-helix repeat protein
MRKSILLLAVAAGFAVVHVGVANAAACGVVTSNTTLTSDCDAPLTVAASGITVDLNGHSVVCNAPVDGIVLPATTSFSVVRNGTVRSGSASCGSGVLVDGNSNQLTSLQVHNPSNYGVRITGDANVVNSVGADHSANNGFIVLGGDRNVIRNSVAMNNSDDGFGFFLGFDNEISFSLAFANADKGIINGASRTTIQGNNVPNNARGIYLSDASSNSLVRFNTVRSNQVGIEINNTSFANRIQGNTSFMNVLDMADDNPACDLNVWLFNSFSTANQGCIH